MTRSHWPLLDLGNELLNAGVARRETWWPRRTPGMTAEFDAVNCRDKASFSAGSRLIHSVGKGTESTNKVAYGPPVERWACARPACGRAHTARTLPDMRAACFKSARARTVARDRGVARLPAQRVQHDRSRPLRAFVTEYCFLPLKLAGNRRSLQASQ